jgi:hypothetical protein
MLVERVQPRRLRSTVRDPRDENIGIIHISVLSLAPFYLELQLRRFQTLLNDRAENPPARTRFQPVRDRMLPRSTTGIRILFAVRSPVPCPRNIIVAGFCTIGRSTVLHPTTFAKLNVLLQLLNRVALDIAALSLRRLGPCLPLRRLHLVDRIAYRLWGWRYFRQYSSRYQSEWTALPRIGYAAVTDACARLIDQRADVERSRADCGAPRGRGAFDAV